MGSQKDLLQCKEGAAKDSFDSKTIPGGERQADQSKVPSDFPRGNGATRSEIPLTPQNLLFLQRTVGNRAVGQLIQTKLEVSQPGDRYEQEADQVAEAVMRMPASPSQSPLNDIDNVLNPTVSRLPSISRIQTSGGEGSFQAPSHVETQINQMQGGGQALPGSERDFFESRMGYDFSGVRIHTDANAIQASRDIQAQAFTVGNHIAFNEGAYQPGSGTGRRLMAHELAHVSQQTGGLKKEEASSPQTSIYRSPALQMRSQLRTSSLSRLVIQRAITTSGGEWDTDQYDLVQTAAGVRGVDIKLRFTPRSNVDAELIGLTQSVQAFVNNAPNLTPAAATRAIPAADAININTGPSETDEGSAIDRASSYNNPIYPVQSRPSTSLDDPNTAATWGQNGWHYRDNSGSIKKQDAILIDEPRRSNAAKDSRHIFETTALATKGSQAGTYYGSVRWGWRTDDKGNFTKLSLSKVSEGVPSSTFMKAAEFWNSGKSSTGDKNVNLPIVDVKITTAPITGVYPAGFIGPPLQIPTGTRVQITRNATPPSTNGQIKVVDGIFTGNTLEVTPADMTSIRDERS